MITGTWHGKINRQKVEVKIIQKGDSLTGTSYYYESPTNYRRYSIKGYFDKNNNDVIWWDDQLIDERTGKFSLSSPGKNAMLSRADFNCPGGGVMMLDGKSALKENEKPNGEVHLDKVNGSSFEDEWNFVIDNYTVGANDPEIIDSVASIALRPTIIETPVSIEKPAPIAPPVVLNTSPPAQRKEEPVVKPAPEIPKPVPPPTNEEKFHTRQSRFTKEIPVYGDSIELRFYDNAEIDGDSIALFLNGKMIFEHIRLAAEAYKIKLAVKDLNDTNELIMVAENLGTIPPNTSYMIVMVDGQRYDANLASTEETSAMVRFVKRR